MRRWLLGIALVAASLSRLNCDLVFKLKDPIIRGPFLGCFKGAITEPTGQGEITIVLEAAPGDDTSNMLGCMTSIQPLFDATMTGAVLEDGTQARFAVMPQGGRPAFVLLVSRQPAQGNATGLTLVNESDMPFKRAQDLPRCATTVTCADLGISQPFLPGGAP